VFNQSFDIVIRTTGFFLDDHQIKDRTQIIKQLTLFQKHQRLQKRQKLNSKTTKFQDVLSFFLSYYQWK
jgi:hypothetical protein